MLKKTGVKLELTFNINQFQFIERGIRGGVSYICERYAKANNKYISDYDPTKPSTYITYLDSNNFYGWAMSEDLPTGGFYSVPVEEIDFRKKIFVGFLKIKLIPQKKVMKDSFLKLMWTILNTFMVNTTTIPQLQRG